MIDKHFTWVLCCLMKLHDKTLRCVVHFLAGSLPATALLHIRQLGLFAMICRLPDNILHSYAIYYFSSDRFRKSSWFSQVHLLCKLYSLPDPLTLLSDPPEKNAFKVLTKKRVISYWEILLRSEAKALKSLKFFRPEYMSLSKPHPIFSSAGSSPSKVSMSLIQAKMLSGRYRCEALLKHWKSTSNGKCNLSRLCDSEEDVQHILQHCTALEPTRRKLQAFTEAKLESFPSEIQNIIKTYCVPSSVQFCDFLLDCSVLPLVISSAQPLGDDVLHTLFNLAGTWVYSLHRERLKLLGIWKASGNWKFFCGRRPQMPRWVWFILRALRLTAKFHLMDWSFIFDYAIFPTYCELVIGQKFYPVMDSMAGHQNCQNLKTLLCVAFWQSNKHTYILYERWTMLMKHLEWLVN